MLAIAKTVGLTVLGVIVALYVFAFLPKPGAHAAAGGAAPPPKAG